MAAVAGYVAGGDNMLAIDLRCANCRDV